MNIKEYRLFYKGTEEWNGTKESCKRVKFHSVRKGEWLEKHIEIKGGFDPRPSFNISI